MYRVKTLCLFLNLSFGLDIENVTILSRTPCAKKCSSETMTLKLKVKLNNLQILTCLHFPPSWLFLFTLSSSSSLTLFTLVWKRDEDLNVIEREESRLAVEHALVPVFVNLIGQSDDVAFVEAQLSLVFWLKVVQGLTAGLLQAWVYTRKERMRKIRLGRDQKNGGNINSTATDALRVRDRSSAPLEKTSTCIVLHAVFEIWWHKNHTMLWHHIPVCVTHYWSFPACYSFLCALTKVNREQWSSSHTNKLSLSTLNSILIVLSSPSRLMYLCET